MSGTEERQFRLSLRLGTLLTILTNIVTGLGLGVTWAVFYGKHQAQDEAQTALVQQLMASSKDRDQKLAELMDEIARLGAEIEGVSMRVDDFSGLIRLRQMNDVRRQQFLQDHVGNAK